MNKQKTLALSIILVLGATLLWMLFFWNPAQDQSVKHTSLELSATPVGGDFVVETQDKDLALKDLRGKVVVLYFGYTLCPDICPTSLSLLTQALNQMNEDELSAMQSIFVSVDPERDNTTRLDTYTKYFHSNLVGATAEKSEIDRMTKLYGASYRVVKSDSAMGYIVDHSAYTYLIDKTGKLRYSLDHGTASKEILEALRVLLAE